MNTLQVPSSFGYCISGDVESDFCGIKFKLCSSGVPSDDVAVNSIVLMSTRNCID